MSMLLVLPATPDEIPLNSRNFKDLLGSSSTNDDAPRESILELRAGFRIRHVLFGATTNDASPGS